MQFQREVLDSIRRILRALRESSRAAETDLGISGAQLLVLQNLSSGDPLSINDLAARTQTHQSSVSVVVAKLEEAGLVKRSVSPEDARKMQIALSSSGTKLLKKMSRELAHQRLFDAIAELPQTKQKQLAILLSEVVERAGFAETPATLFFEDDSKERSR